MNVLIFIFAFVADTINIIMIIEAVGNNSINNLLCKSMPNLHQEYSSINPGTWNVKYSQITLTS